MFFSSRSRPCILSYSFNSEASLSLVKAVLLFLLLLTKGKALFQTVRNKKEKISAYCHMPCLWRLVWYRTRKLWKKELWSSTLSGLAHGVLCLPWAIMVVVSFQLFNTWGASALHMVFQPFLLSLSWGVTEHKTMEGLWPQLMFKSYVYSEGWYGCISTNMSWIGHFFLFLHIFLALLSN